MNERCDWCDVEYDVDDWTDIGEPSCEDCDVDFCSVTCLAKHKEDCPCRA